MHARKTAVLAAGPLVVLALTGCRAVGEPEIATPSSASSGLPIPFSALPMPSFSRPTVDPAEALRDAEITACTVDSHHLPRIEVKVTNHSRWPTTYFVDVDIADESGARLGTGLADVEKVAPGRTAAGEAPSATVVGGETISCKVVKVSRYEITTG
ncbi:FxLYD domain-containing protein [Kitasatospora cinereorecta]|uniref:FxLYD domain-containing protein n=1 Tax=Kitasatospora cinereorecta TaxID=285560 RepID=A0ABW0V856_9ACTN